MTVGSALIFIICLVVFACVAYWLITKFFPDPIRMIALVIVGAICLFALIYKFAPGVMGTHVG